MPLSSPFRSALLAVLAWVSILASPALAQALPAGALDVADIAPKDLAVPDFAIEGLELADLLLVSAYQPEPPLESVLVATDGTDSGTRVILRLPTTLDGLGVADAADGLAFYAAGAGDTSQIWVSDGTTAGSRPVGTVAGEVLGGHAVGDRVVFLVGDGPDEGIWASDGTAAGLQKLAATETFFLEIDDAVVLSNGRLVMHDTADPDAEMPRLWSTDGTAAGTLPLATTANGSFLGRGRWFAGASDGRVVPFSARVQGVGTELFVTDGTVAGTEILASFTPGAASSRIDRLVYEPVSDHFYAFAGPDDGPVSLWQISPAGGVPVLVSDLESQGEPDFSSAVDLDLAVHGGRVLWTVRDTLWASDAFPQPVFLTDLVPGAEGEGAGFYGARVGPEVVVQGLDSGVDETYLWTTDGTPDGTERYPEPELGFEVRMFGSHVSDAGRVYVQVGNHSGLGGPLDLVRLAPDAPVELTDLENSRLVARPILGDVAGRTVFRVAEIVPFGAPPFEVRSGRLWSTDGTAAGTGPLPEIPDAAPAHPDRPPMTSPAVPGFRFWVRITPQLRDPIPGTREGACIPETVCVSGALPGRTEVFLRVIGPRPNGLLWPVVTRFTPSLVEVWIEQVSTGDTRYYVLPATAADSGELTGLFDRDGFVP